MRGGGGRRSRQSVYYEVTEQGRSQSRIQSSQMKRGGGRRGRGIHQRGSTWAGATTMKTPPSLPPLGIGGSGGVILFGAGNTIYIWWERGRVD